MTNHELIAQTTEMSLKDLIAIKDHLDALIEKKRASGASQALKNIEQMLERAGFSLEDVGLRVARAKMAKYLNPDNPNQTWSGRGRQPRWMTNAIAERGMKLEDFEVQEKSDKQLSAPSSRGK
jgi:DNA-binding protein H-NS